MIRALNTAAAGMSAQESNVNTISNNIANVNTTGFKRARAEFEDLLYETITEAGSRTSASTQHTIGHQIGSGSKVSGVRKIHQQGEPTITNNPYDMMINGDGFFGVIAPDNSIVYTRDGSFAPNAQGTLVNNSGYALFPGITIPPTTVKLNVSEDGNVDAYVNGQTEPQNLGVVPVFNFINASGLKSLGKNLYRPTTASGAPTQSVAGQNNSGFIMQGSLEASNVNIMNEMTGLIKAQRAYEMNSKVMGVADQMLQTVNNVK